MVRGGEGMILSYENIEHIAAGVAKDFCNAILAGEKSTK